MQWESQGLREVSIDLHVLIPEIETAERVTQLVKAKISRRNKPMYQPSHLFQPSIARALMMIDEGEDGEPEESDDEIEGGDEDEDLNEIVTGLNDDIFQLAPDFRNEEEKEKEEEEEAKCGDIKFRWRSDVHLNAPGEKSQYGDSKVKKQHHGCFVSPLSSLMAFIPIKIFFSLSIDNECIFICGCSTQATQM